jgi:hypothetical protein
MYTPVFRKRVDRRGGSSACSFFPVDVDAGLLRAPGDSMGDLYLTSFGRPRERSRGGAAIDGSKWSSADPSPAYEFTFIAGRATSSTTIAAMAALA